MKERCKEKVTFGYPTQLKNDDLFMAIQINRNVEKYSLRDDRATSDWH